jgi:short subunit dehydrogenase-like uncharacterized protein
LNVQKHSSGGTLRVMTRDLDIVLYGATGYTGRLVADLLATHGAAPGAENLRGAIAGRDRAKLEAVRDALGRPELETLVADAADGAALDAMCARTRVVCTTVGPYALYGDELVAACVRQGTHACDLTGETQWIRRTIDRHHDAARQSGAKIVHCCGFDSIPSDLGVWMMDEAMRARGRRLARVDSFFGDAKGKFSGGTVASMLNLQEELTRDPSLRRLMFDPYALVPGGSGPDRRDLGGVSYDERLGRYTAPFIMAGVNAPIVRRSNALLDYRYGRDFRYHESMSFGDGVKGLAVASLFTAGLGAGFAALQVPGLRRMIAARLPKPGEGPTPEERAAGHFVVRYVAEADTTDGGPPLTLRGRSGDRRDPGYGSTSVMLAASALCLARDVAEGGDGGILTPASAMAAPLLARLRAAGMTWEVETAS